MKVIYPILFLLFAVLPAVAQPLPALIPYTDGVLWGYADTTGRPVIKPQWKEVAFFIGNHANVVCGETKAYGPTHCKIDREGRYIIPPGRNWVHRISYGGKEQYMLNCHDSAGRWGFIDSANNLLIPFAFDAPLAPYDQEMPDSLMVVARDGYRGVIDFRGNEVLPCRYADVHVVRKLYRALGAFAVADADNASGLNRWGVAQAGGKMIMQMRHCSIEFADGLNPGFKVGVIPADGAGQGVARHRFISWPSMVQEPVKPGQPVGIPEVRLGKYILQGATAYYTLLDTNRKVLMEQINEVRNDTVVQVKLEQRSDSLIQTSLFFALNDLKLKHTDIRVRYSRPWEYDHPRYVCGTGARMAAEARASERPKPNIPGYGQYFFKDSFYFETRSTLYSSRAGFVSTPAERSPFADVPATPGELYIVHGDNRVRSGYGGYTAVLNKDLNYVLPPIIRAEILGFNGADSMVSAGSAVYHLNHGVPERLPNVPQGVMAGAFRWQGKMYFCTTQERKRKPSRFDGYHDGNRTNPGRNELRVCDANGMYKGNWTTHTLADEVPDHLLPPGIIGFWAKDTNGVVSALDPDGAVLLPQISGKYAQVTAWGNWLHVTDTARNGRTRNAHIVDLRNNDLLPGYIVTSVNQPQRRGAFGLPYPPYSRIFEVQVQAGEKGGWHYFFADDKGTLYTTAAAPRPVKKKGRP